MVWSVLLVYLQENIKSIFDDPLTTLQSLWKDIYAHSAQREQHLIAQVDSCVTIALDLEFASRQVSANVNSSVSAPFS
jgi:hypothetical protein